MYSTLYRKYLLFGLVVILLLPACGNKQEQPSSTAPGKNASGPPPAKLEAWIVKTTALSDNLELPGTLLANETTPINPEISGRLTHLNINEGRTVSKGTLLAKIYDGDLKAQLNKLQIQARVQEQTAKRYEELLKIQGVSQQEYDLAKLEINNIYADMAVVKSNIMRTEIRAPFNGTLGLKQISPGAYVTPSTILTTIRQNNVLKLDYTLPERYSNKVEIGRLISFTVEGSTQNYSAKIIASESGVTENNRTLNVRAQVLNNDGKLLPGQFVKVRTNFDPDPNAIMIPSQAIIPQARGKKVAVYRNGVADFVDVQTAARDSATVQVITGLKVGDTIITTGLMSLKPNGKVQIGKIISH
ncbi:MAG TPA: efflux RND transporter periplasmic adaptor subunit [Ferruginibacter sp.]|nr:efflux RND transporter periplasmic adaptor subunit [Ferruginibacter sp.]